MIGDDGALPTGGMVTFYLLEVEEYQDAEGRTKLGFTRRAPVWLQAALWSGAPTGRADNVGSMLINTCAQARARLRNAAATASPSDSPDLPRGLAIFRTP